MFKIIYGLDLKYLFNFNRLSYLSDKWWTREWVCSQREFCMTPREILYLRITWNGTTSRSVRALFRPIIRDQKASHYRRWRQRSWWKAAKE